MSGGAAWGVGSIRGIDLHIDVSFDRTAQSLPAHVYPDHWPKDLSEVQKIKVPEPKYTWMKKTFRKSIGIAVKVINIEEICNTDFFDKYEG